MTRLSPHFDSREFSCKDGCGWQAVDPLLIERLEILRSALKMPIRITSGRRCPVHNRNVLGALRSRHVYGDAADIPRTLRVTVAQAREAGFTGIGHLASGYVVHVDVRPQRNVTVWSYR